MANVDSKWLVLVEAVKLLKRSGIEALPCESFLYLMEVVLCADERSGKGLSVLNEVEVGDCVAYFDKVGRLIAFGNTKEVCIGVRDKKVGANLGRIIKLEVEG